MQWCSKNYKQGIYLYISTDMLGPHVSYGNRFQNMFYRLLVNHMFNQTNLEHGYTLVMQKYS